MEIGGDAKRLGKADVRQVDRVRAARRQIGDERRVTRPQAGIVAGAREMNGEGRSPSTGTEDCDATNTPLPKRLSAF
jgi:hypothetical protein